MGMMLAVAGFVAMFATVFIGATAPKGQWSLWHKIRTVLIVVAYLVGCAWAGAQLEGDETASDEASFEEAYAEGQRVGYNTALEEKAQYYYDIGYTDGYDYGYEAGYSHGREDGPYVE